MLNIPNNCGVFRYTRWGLDPRQEKWTWIWGSTQDPRYQFGEIGRGSGALERVQQTQAKGGLIRPDVSYPVLALRYYF